MLSCLSTRADYWAQTMYMSASRSFLADFDTAITSAASDASGEAGPLILADNLARKRLRMPIRGGGGGLRLRVGVADAAFFGAGCAVLPTMVDRLVGGSTVAGFMTQLEPELGQGSFERGDLGPVRGPRGRRGLRVLHRRRDARGLGLHDRRRGRGGGLRGPPREALRRRGRRRRGHARPQDAAPPDGGARQGGVEAYKPELADLAIDDFTYCAAEAARDLAARAWLTTLPVGGAVITNGEFAKAAGTYFGARARA